MSAGISSIKVEGGARLRRTLKKAGVDVNQLKEANRQAASTVAARARSTAPVGPPKAGHIKSNIRVGATQRAGVVRAGSSRYPYARAIHYGRPSKNVKANPWISYAAQDTEGTWALAYEQAINKVLNQVKGV